VAAAQELAERLSPRHGATSPDASAWAVRNQRLKPRHASDIRTASAIAPPRIACWSGA
jgi:hypothetical protein